MAEITNESSFWNRIGYVEIENIGGKWDRYGGEGDALDFKFEGTYAGDMCAGFKVGILGLSMDTINKLTVWRRAESTETKRGIRVYAGYSKDGISNPLFDGYIIQAIPTSPPEMWLNFECLTMIDKNRPIMDDLIAKNAPLINILTQIGEEWNLPVRWDAEKVNPDHAGNFIFTGKTPQMMADEFSNKFNVLLFCDHNVLVCQDKQCWTNPPKRADKLSTETGLLGIAELTQKGATLIRRLDGKVSTFSCINLESKLIPKANGIYRVIKITHKGHFRGDEWITSLMSVREED